MQILLTTDPTAIKIACDVLARGELVIYPTETCYGIAADSTNVAAVTKLLAFKGDRHRQVSIAVTDQLMAKKYVKLNDIAKNLYQNFLPGPITVISDSLHQVDERLESSDGKLGVRIPKHAFALKLIQIYGKPITATSANTSGKKEPYSLSDWQKYTTTNKQKLVNLFLDAGKLVERPTSTVVDTTLNDPSVLRQGEIQIPALSQQTFLTHSAEETQKVAAGILHRTLNLLHKFPLIIALQGELGAGKTQMSKGFAQELNIAEPITSPTYTLMHEYEYNNDKYAGMFYHLDTWRLSDMTELDSTLHLSTLLKQGNIVVLEWATKAKSFVESHKNESAILLIDIKEIDESTRQITYAVSTPEWT